MKERQEADTRVVLTQAKLLNLLDQIEGLLGEVKEIVIDKPEPKKDGL